MEAQELGYGESTDYGLIFEERTYPPKTILGYAAQRIVGRPLAADEFSGGGVLLVSLFCDHLLFRSQTKYLCLKAIQLWQVWCAAMPTTGRRSHRYLTQVANSPLAQAAGVCPVLWKCLPIVVILPFLVTLGKPHKGKPYQDELTEDGFLIWELQKQHTMDSLVIQKLLTHDSEQNNIHLFLRGNPELDYTYFGLLKYFSHDEYSSAPVHFIWRVLN